MLIILATEETGDTPSSPFFVTATPTPERNNPTRNKTQRKINFLSLFKPSLSR